MARYELECPACGVRRPLDPVVPDERVRCGACRAVMIVPAPPGTGIPERPAAPASSVRGLGRLVLVAALLVSGVLIGGSAILDAQARRRAPEAPPPAPPPPITLATLAEVNAALPMPVSRGRTWSYVLDGGGREQRRVGTLGGGPGGAPTADVAATGSADAGARTYRVDREALWLLEERRGGQRWSLEDPVRWIPHPLYAEDRWEISATAAGAKGAREAWRIQAAVVKTERVEVPAGVFACYRIDYRGMKGARPVEESWWVAKGTGLVKRRSVVDGRVEEARLERVSD